MRYFGFILLFFSSFLFAEEELVVHVAAENALSPLYMHLLTEKAHFDTAYIQELEKILRFDLNHNAKTTTLTPTKECATVVAKERSWKTFYRNEWETLHIPHVVKISIADKVMSVALFSVKQNTIQGFEGVELTGNLNTDRQTLHRVSDTVHEMLFGTKGIANCRILYTVRTKRGASSNDWVTEVWEADYDGANAQQLTHDQNLCLSPTYFPPDGHDGASAFFYVSYRIGQPKIYAARMGEGIGRRFSFLRGDQFTPTISPRGDLVAFVSDVTGNPELFVQGINRMGELIGKPRQIFSAPAGAQGCPTFSPDGRQIAFVSNKDGTPRIYAMEIPPAGAAVEELKPKLLTKCNRDNTCPAWSPDGTKLAYASMSKGVRQIWIYDFVTGKETPLTEGPSNKENPSWAPNSLHLLFNTATTTGGDLWMVNLHQTEMIKISQGLGEKRFPAWEPRVL